MPTIGITHLDMLRTYAYMVHLWYKANTDLSFDEWLDIKLNETESAIT